MIEVEIRYDKKDKKNTNFIPKRVAKKPPSAGDIIMATEPDTSVKEKIKHALFLHVLLAINADNAGAQKFDTQYNISPRSNPSQWSEYAKINAEGVATAQPANIIFLREKVSAAIPPGMGEKAVMK